MDRTNIEKPFHIKIEEYERGWGSKIDEIIGFDTKEEANAYIKKYNAANNEPTVPDWYMVASPKNYTND